MEQTKHTPGPWHSRPVGFRGHMEVFTASDDLIAALHLRDDTAANARLIAAAPELLAALIGAEKCIAKSLTHLPPETLAAFAGEWLGEIRAAIAKATGGE